MTFEHEHLPHFLSLGAGVQSSTLALMYAMGELEPMPKAAIFADTQDEPQQVYDWLDWLETQLPFEVVRVTAGRLSESATEMRHTAAGSARLKTSLPVFTESGGRVARRSCTRDFKIRPIHRELKQRAKFVRGGHSPVCVSVIGISLDEFQRMKPSREPQIAHRWPLIERRITRQGCYEWMERNGYPNPPRSACVYCPNHSPNEWRRLQLLYPDEFQRAVEFERELQERSPMTETPYLHRSCKPLDQVDFRSDIERGQQLLWDDECEGMCGT